MYKHFIACATAAALAGCLGDVESPPIADTAQPLKDTTFERPEDEDCHAGVKELAPDVAAAQQTWHAPDKLREDMGRSHERLIEPLRAAAKTRDSQRILVQSVAEHIRSMRGEPDALALAQAHADLAVTGRAAHAHFRWWHPRDADVVWAVNEALGRGAFEPADATPAEIALGATRALDRAYRVVWALRGPTDQRIELRPTLGWIAVSGEDDSPHRPVNVPSALYPQYDIDFTVEGELGPVPVTLRYVLASESTWLDRGPLFSPRALPPDGHGFVPTGDDVLIYIPGHGSRAEEAMHMAPHLIAQARALGRSLTVLSIDLPSAAYASRIEHTLIAPSEHSNHNTGYPVLDFLEQTIVELVAELDAHQPGVSAQIVGVMGGSLGGNLGLRLARRDPAKFPWLRNVAAWSPASVWESWGPARPHHGEGVYYDVAKYEAVRVTRDRMRADESPEFRPFQTKEARTWFFDDVYGPPLPGFPPVSERWWAKGWPCKDEYIAGSVRAMDEVYGPEQRRWHWRVAHEQLIFSHRDPDPGETEMRFRSIKARLLLAAGAADNSEPEYLYDRAVMMAADLPETGGRAIFLLDTGHSIHDERPMYWGSYVAKFFMDHPAYEPPPLLASILAAF